MPVLVYYLAKNAKCEQFRNIVGSAQKACTNCFIIHAVFGFTAR